MEQSTAVCVIGPGRAGTSMTMRALNLIGVDVGSPEGLVDPGPGGPKGFWERREIIALNDRLLRLHGGSWRSPPQLAPGWERAPELEEERERARTLLDETFSGKPLWGWKDPRVSLTTAFWLELVPNLRFVVCLRNPIDTADSISPPADRKSKDGFYYSRRGVRGERAYRLWSTYVSSALANTTGRPRLVVAYEDHFEDRRATVERLARFVDRDPPPRGGEVEQRLEDFVDPSLRHYSTPNDEALRDDRLPPEAVALYAEAQALRAAQNGALSQPGGAER